MKPKRTELTAAQLVAAKLVARKGFVNSSREGFENVLIDTNEKVAKELDINPSTLYAWMKLDAFKEEVSNQNRAFGNEFAYENVTKGLIGIAHNANEDKDKINAYRLIAEIQGLLNKRQDINLTQTVKSEHDDVSDYLASLGLSAPVSTD